jgi:hypothetical protein
MALCFRGVLLINGLGLPLRNCDSAHSRLSVQSSSITVGRKNITARATVCSKKYKLYEAVKVYQDASRGIVCYRNEYGELICEGYDEGPHLRHTQQQEEQYRQDVKLYGCIQEIRPYLVEGIDYTCMGGDLVEAFSEGKDES